MSDKNMKNIVVLKNLPSNLVDEAIVILKSKKTAKKLELIEKNSNVKKSSRNIETKYKKIKTYSIFISIVLFFCLIRIIF